MEKTEVTRRVKQAIRIWAQDADAKVLLDDKLSKFQNGDLDGLRPPINGEFRGCTGFPVSSATWRNLTLKTVRDVRDAVLAILEGGDA